jgi:hypothetical protein
MRHGFEDVRVNGFETRAKEASFFKEAMSRADGIAMLMSCSVWAATILYSHLSNGEGLLLMMPFIFSAISVLIYLVRCSFDTWGIAGAIVITGVHIALWQGYPI